MSAQNYRRDVYYLNQTPIALTVADTIMDRICVPRKIMRFGIFVTTAIADAAGDGWVYKLDRRPTPGSDTGRTTLATITGAAVEGQAVGKVLEVPVGTASTSAVAVDGSTVVSGQVQGAVVNIGDEIVFAVTNAAATAGAGIPFYEYLVLGVDDGSQTDRVKKTG